MNFKATDEQIKTLAANAVNASQPMGMGFMHATNKEFKPEEFDVPESGVFSLDYVQGRMVKLTLWKKDGEWKTPERDPHPEYQSWIRRYPTYGALLESAGIKVEP